MAKPHERRFEKLPWERSQVRVQRLISSITGWWQRWS